MKRETTIPWGGLAFAVALNLACLIPGAKFFAPMLIGVGWLFGAVWSLRDLGRSVRARSVPGMALAAVGLVLCFTPSLWLVRP